MIWLLYFLIPHISHATDQMLGLVDEEPTERERLHVDHAECHGFGRNPLALVALLRIEDMAGVPESRRGILAAIWCIESKWAPSGTNIYGDQGAALGPLQMHVEHTRRCYAGYDVAGGSLDRTDLYVSAACWLARVEALRVRAEVRCGKLRGWDVAEAMVSSGALTVPCGAQSSHVRALEAHPTTRPSLPAPARRLVHVRRP